LNRVFLTGFMGSGKSTVSRVLAGRMGWPFTDLDDEIVARAGMSISEIFESLGEENFRSMESDLLFELGTGPGIMSLGGGALMNPGSRKFVMESGLVIYLRATPGTLAERLAREAGSRPLLAESDSLADTVQNILVIRKDIYEEAHWIIDTDDLDPGQVADLIYDRILEEAP
jgi:shikimate kinase